MFNKIIIPFTEEINECNICYEKHNESFKCKRCTFSCCPKCFNNYYLLIITIAQFSGFKLYILILNLYNMNYNINSLRSGIYDVNAYDLTSNNTTVLSTLNVGGAIIGPNGISSISNLNTTSNSIINNLNSLSNYSYFKYKYYKY
jgi:hypothetical protein